MCLASSSGATLELAEDAASATGWWFGEDQGRYLVAATAEDANALLDLAAERGVIARRIGRTGGDALIMGAERPISLSELRAVHEGWLVSYMAGGQA